MRLHSFLICLHHFAVAFASDIILKVEMTLSNRRLCGLGVYIYNSFFQLLSAYV